MLVAVLIGMIVLNQVWPSESGRSLSYTEFVAEVQSDNVVSFSLTNGSNSISGELADGSTFTTTVRDNFPNEAEIALLAEIGRAHV